MTDFCQTLVDGPWGSTYFVLGLIIIFIPYVYTYIAIGLSLYVVIRDKLKKVPVNTPALKKIWKRWLYMLIPLALLFGWVEISNCFVWYA